MREELLDAAEAMVQERGLNAVSFQDLADAVGLRKPSVFHHFPNKEALACALVDRCQTKHGPKYQAVVDSDLQAPEKLRRFAGIFEEGLQTNTPCLIAALGVGVNTLPDSAADVLGEVARGALQRFTLVFEQGRQEESLHFDGAPTDAARGFFAMLQGLQVLVRASGSTDDFHAATNAFIDSISTH